VPLLNNIVNSIKLNLKNIPGWKTDSKIVIFAVDDFGNVRLDSSKARESMTTEGLKIYNRFDAFDSLENRQDLEMLYEVLISVKDAHGKNAVFTPFAVPCNIDFEKIDQNKNRQYFYELLPATFEKLEASYPISYKGTWNLWQEGIKYGLMAPQFHGREHLNLKVFKEKLNTNDKELLICLKNRSYSSLSSSGYSTINYTAAFDFWDYSENKDFDFIIEDGLNAFEKVFGYRSVHFNPPGGREHICIHNSLRKNGIKYLDTPLLKKEHQGNGKFKTRLNFLGKMNELDMIYNIRNVLFEPTDRKDIDWVSFTLKQIETAFSWNKPAVISTHRVNFCGNISGENRATGLNMLRKLLKGIINKWPEVEFCSSVELLDKLRDKMAK